MIVFLNKQDLLRKKIESGRKLEKYFPAYVDYKMPQKSGPVNEYERAKHYMRQEIVVSE